MLLWSAFPATSSFDGCVSGSNVTTPTDIITWNTTRNGTVSVNTSAGLDVVCAWRLKPRPGEAVLINITHPMTCDGDTQSSWWSVNNGTHNQTYGCNEAPYPMLFTDVTVICVVRIPMDVGPPVRWRLQLARVSRRVVRVCLWDRGAVVYA